MPQSLTQRVVNTFIKGLITEAGELTFPPDASVDELNCDLLRDGTRRRRKGVKRESGASSSFFISSSTVVNTGTWYNVGGESGIEYLIIQAGSELRFYNKVGSTLSDKEVVGSVNLALYKSSPSKDPSTTLCSFTSLKGSLIVASDAINSIVIERDNLQQTFTVTEISFRVRDFDWQGDTTEYYESKASPSNERKYDTQNAGWVAPNGDTALSSYQTAHSNEHPPLTHSWYSGKDSSGSFSATEWDKIYTGTTLTGNGHYILDFFAKDRATVSGISGLEVETEASRFKTVASFAGRVFYAGLNSAKNSEVILFSQLADTTDKLGECLQSNDPTSEQISDLLATDGGVIRVAGASNIKLLHVIDASLYIFADNGIWRIEGIDGVFSPTAFAVRKISDVGILNANSFVSADGSPIWWSRQGIHTLQFDPSTGRPVESNLSIGTIQTYWDNIPPTSKEKVRCTFDPINKRVYWAWPDEDETIESKLNNFLVLDAVLKAFFPWKVSDDVTNPPFDITPNHVCGLCFYSGYGAGEQALDVLTSNGDDVITTAGDDVVSLQILEEQVGNSGIFLLNAKQDYPGQGNPLQDKYRISFATFTSEGYKDWDANYTSFAEAGYDFMGDLLLKKSAPYVTTYMRRTETAYVDDGLGGYELDKPSGMYVSSFWDFKNTASSAAQQAYRFKYPTLGEGTPPTFTYPEDVITTRLKLRGRGRSMRLRFESEEGKDFVLLGYSILGGVNPRH